MAMMILTSNRTTRCYGPRIGRRRTDRTRRFGNDPKGLKFTFSFCLDRIWTLTQPFLFPIRTNQVRAFLRTLDVAWLSSTKSIRKEEQ